MYVLLLVCHYLANILQQYWVLEKRIKVNRLHLLLEFLEHVVLLLCSTLDQFDLVVDLVEDIVADQVLHVQIVDYNLNPGCSLILIELLLR